MKKLFIKIKNWLFRPVSAKLKTGGVIFPLCALFTYSIILSIIIHWTLAIVPLFLLLIVLYTAKLPVKIDEKSFSKVVKKYGKK